MPENTQPFSPAYEDHEAVAGRGSRGWYLAVGDDVVQRGEAATRFLARMARRDQDSRAVADIPRRVCAVCRDVLAMTGAAVMLMAHPSQRHTLQASSLAVSELEELQYTLGEGPSVEAFTSGHPVLVPDLSVPDMRWPVFSSLVSLAHPDGVGGVFAFPLQQVGVTIGVLSLTRDDPGGGGSPRTNGSSVC